MSGLQLDSIALQNAIQTFPRAVEVCLTYLIQCRTVAKYDNPKLVASGREAVTQYLQDLSELLPDVYAELIYNSEHCSVLVSPDETKWDKKIVVKFPNINAVVSLFSMEEYLAAQRHYHAGVEQAEIIVSHS